MFHREWHQDWFPFWQLSTHHKPPARDLLACSPHLDPSVVLFSFYSLQLCIFYFASSSFTHNSFLPILPCAFSFAVGKSHHLSSKSQLRFPQWHEILKCIYWCIELLTNPLVELKDLLGHQLKELCTRCSKITLHCIYYIIIFIYGKEH